MSSTLREAAQQALEALLTYEQYIQPLTNVFGGPRVPQDGSASAKVDAAIAALRAALAEPPGSMPQHEQLKQMKAQRKAMSDLTIADIYVKWDATPGASMADFARAIERAHGIGK